MALPPFHSLKFQNKNGVMAYVVLAYVVLAYVVLAYVVMASGVFPLEGAPACL